MRDANIFSISERLIHLPTWASGSFCMMVRSVLVRVACEYVWTEDENCDTSFNCPLVIVDVSLFIADVVILTAILLISAAKACLSASSMENPHPSPYKYSVLLFFTLYQL